MQYILTRLVKRVLLHIHKDNLKITIVKIHTKNNINIEIFSLNKFKIFFLNSFIWIIKIINNQKNH